LGKIKLPQLGLPLLSAFQYHRRPDATFMDERTWFVTTTLRQLATLVHGEVQGDAELPISAARTLGEAQPGDISFIENDKHAAELHRTRASAVVVPPALPTNGLPVIRVADPLTAFITIVRHLHGIKEPPLHGIDPKAAIHPSVKIGPEPSVHPFAVIGEGTTIGARCRIHAGVVIGRRCQLGDDVIVYPNAVLYDGTILGQRVIVHANAVLGADGFGYRFTNGQHVKVPQLGHVEIGDDVEIGACATVDRGTFQATRIGKGTKIDNLVQVAHNCKIGQHNVFASQVGIAGSSTTGDYVVMAGQVGIADHLHIGTGAVIGAKAGVAGDVPDGQRTLGCPATPEREQKRILMSLNKLTDMRKDLQRIKLKLGMKDEEEKRAAG
jgi:UDP-3-O-[3-hydroxymyristoyl] glucosamine N-acyltransferase